MNQEAYNNTKKWLSDYAFSFAGKGESRDFLIKLKFDHSLRVADDCKTIAYGLGWSDPDVFLGGVIGLLHDVGRFTQLAEFGTFSDPHSVNHGERGYEVACKVGLPELVDDDIKQIILEGIRYHNRRILPEDISDTSRRFLDLVRDADKVDIMHIVDATISNKDHERYPEIMLNIDLHGGANPALVTEIKETGTASYKNVLSLVDLNLVRMSWVYNINYKPALKLISERGLLDKMINTLPKQDDIREITDKALRFIEDRVG